MGCLSVLKHTVCIVYALTLYYLGLPPRALVCLLVSPCLRRGWHPSLRVAPTYILRNLPSYNVQLLVKCGNLNPVPSAWPVDVCNPSGLSVNTVLCGKPFYGCWGQKLQLVFLPRGVHERALQVFPGEGEVHPKWKQGCRFEDISRKWRVYVYKMPKWYGFLAWSYL